MSNSIRVTSITGAEGARIKELVGELHLTRKYLSAAQVPSMAPNFAALSRSAGVAILQLVRTTRMVPRLFGGRETVFRGQTIVSDPDSIVISLFGEGRPLRIETEVEQDLHDAGGVGVSFHPARMPSRFRENCYAADGMPVDYDAIRLAVGPWFPLWVVDVAPEFSSISSTDTVKVLRRLAEDEDARASLDSARRLGGSAAAVELLGSLAIA